MALNAKCPIRAPMKAGVIMVKLILWLCMVGIAIGLLVAFVQLMVEIFLAIWPVLLMTAIAVFGCWLIIKLRRNRKKKLQEITIQGIQAEAANIVRQIQQESAIKAEMQSDYFADSYDLIRSLYTKVVGVSHPNDDGTSRQEILSRCKEGEQLTLDWRTFDAEPACAVISDHGQIGFLKADLAADLYRDYIEWNLEDDGPFIFAVIGNITGGENGLHYGCNIKLSIYQPISPYGDEFFPVAVDFILETGRASVTQLQKHLHIGYARASRLMDELEEKGVVGPHQGSKPRAVVITKEQWESQMQQ